jgi:hypothetical protein
MQNAAATPMFWWWNFLHNRDLYFEFRALASFIDGEDLRDLANRDRRETASSESLPLEAYSFGSDRWRLVWVADPLLVWRVSNEPRPCRNAIVSLSGVKDGSYLIEVWDTTRGERVQEHEAAAAGGTLKLDLPEFTRDIACKVKPKP